MSNFLYLFRGGYDDYNALSQEKKEKLTKDWEIWLGQLKEQGKLIEGLPLSQEGKVVYEQGKLITNGPFAEGVEVVGGYTIVSAKDLEEALEISKGNPHFNFENSILEIREIMSMDV
ncbi:MAG: YciI family protein [Flavobacteriaceae bacterium]